MKDKKCSHQKDPGPKPIFKIFLSYFQLHKRIESLQQQNRVLKCELETYKLRVKSLQEENRSLRQVNNKIKHIFYIV